MRDCRHQSAYLFGAICPACAVGAAIVMPRVSSEATTLHLNEISLILWRTYTAILGACCNAWNSPMKDAERIKSITVRDWAQVKV